MAKVLGQEYQDIEQRKRFLKDNCDRIEETGYMKQFSPDQISEMKDKLSEVSIVINDIEEEKKEQNELFKIRLKPVVEEKSELLKNIKQKSEFVSEPCYVFLNEEDMLIETYNSEGICISERPATQKELQKTIYKEFRTGTNN